MDADVEGLLNYVDKNFSNHEVHLAYEAGCCGFHTARFFLHLGWNVLVVNAADINRSSKDKHFKTDSNDSKKLCNELKKGGLRGIHIPTETEEQLQSLLRHRYQITKQLRSAKNRIKSLLLFHGIKIPKQYDNSNWTNDFVKWLKEVKFSSETGNITLESKIKMYEFIKSEYLEIANKLRSYCRKNRKEEYYLLKSIPGIGGYLSAAILAECGDLNRFDNHRQFASFVGMIPSMAESADNERTRGITPRSRALLRTYLIEAAWVTLRLDPDMQSYYRKHQGKNSKAIITKIAHKLCNRILAVIKTKTPYQINYQNKIVSLR
jgi:transposase